MALEAGFQRASNSVERRRRTCFEVCVVSKEDIGPAVTIVIKHRHSSIASGARRCAVSELSFLHVIASRFRSAFLNLLLLTIGLFSLPTSDVGAQQVPMRLAA